MIRMICAIFFALCLYATPQAQPAPCTAKDGKGIVACVEKAYPQKLAANISLAAREENAKFLRDRVIETARCAGLDVGLNLKRGGPAISVDFLAWRNGKITEGVDIIGSWDDVRKPLSLSWHRYDAPNYGHPTYLAYGPVSCVSQPDPTPVPTPTPVPPVQDAELFKRIEQLEKLNKELSEQFITLRTDIDAELASLIVQIAKIQAELPTVQSRVFKLEQIPVPVGYKCSGRVAFGIPVSCTVTADVNP
jgi:hypothetical protein